MRAVAEAIAESEEALSDYRRGNVRALNYIVGKVMKKTRGRADPALAHRLVAEAVGRQNA